MKPISILNITTTLVAIGLVAFSGTISAWGLTKFMPGSEIAVIILAALFECSKLVGFSLLHRPVPLLLKTALLTVGLLLMSLNIIGVAGWLSSAYEHEQINAKATNHTAEASARAEASLVERQLAAAESNLAAARTAVLKARDDRGRVKAATVVVTTAIQERDALVKQLGAAQASTAKVEGDTISSSSEFAAVAFLAQMFGVDQDRVVHILIAGIASLPDILAALLITAIGFAGHKAQQPVEIATPAPIKVKPAALPAAVETKPVVARKPRQPSRQRAAKRAWRTRRSKAIIAARQQGIQRVK
jgi:hypothetical protein